MELSLSHLSDPSTYTVCETAADIAAAPSRPGIRLWELRAVGCRHRLSHCHSTVVLHPGFIRVWVYSLGLFGREGPAAARVARQREVAIHVPGMYLETAVLAREAAANPLVADVERRQRRSGARCA